jgi:hypothetical protein
MEHEGTLRCLKKASTGPYSEPDESPPHLTPYVFMIHFNIMLPHRYSGFRTKILYPFLISHMRATCLVHLIVLHLIFSLILLYWSKWINGESVNFEMVKLQERCNGKINCSSSISWILLFFLRKWKSASPTTPCLTQEWSWWNTTRLEGNRCAHVNLVRAFTRNSTTI